MVADVDLKNKSEKIRVRTNNSIMLINQTISFKLSFPWLFHSLRFTQSNSFHYSRWRSWPVPKQLKSLMKGNGWFDCFFLAMAFSPFFLFIHRKKCKFTIFVFFICTMVNHQKISIELSFSNLLFFMFRFVTFGDRYSFNCNSVGGRGRFALFIDKLSKIVLSWINIM